YKMNAARALFMSDYQAHSGVDIEVAGRNFDQSEFGGTTNTQVRLNNGSGTTYTMPIKDLNPYHVTFTVGSQPIGTYFVEVSNDGGVHWSRLTSGQTLTIVAKTGNGDPLGLGVSWAQDFKWGSVFNVTTYGATGSDTTNDTVAVQAAINAAIAAGGGVVYFPNGSYYISSLYWAQSGVVLQGQDEYNTKLYYNGAGSTGTFLRADNASLTGFARFSILLANPNARPDTFILINGGNYADITQRTADRVFIANVNLDYPYTSGTVTSGQAPGRGIGASITMKERFLMKDNRFVGWFANNIGERISQYAIFKGNYYEFATGYFQDMATYSFIENNQIVVHPESGQDSHGIFHQSDAYVANNSISGAGAYPDNSDGESIAYESGGGIGNFNSGTITSATANSITVTANAPLSNPTLQYGDLSIIITGGRGLGQLRKVSSISGNIITLTAPFDVQPDNTSMWTLLAPNKNITIYNNTANNNVQGILAYANGHDVVIANNTLTNTHGIVTVAANRGATFNLPAYFS
ncbi:MAG: hypothetical protein L0287_02330, partial [Anaerolineae bacterium]|nr:hypothetical protein [Anaerolineae bacterium]